MSGNYKIQTNGAQEHSFDVLILDAENRQALVALRSLGKKGLRVAVLGNYGKKVPAFSSRWCAASFQSPAPEGTEKYIKFLISLLHSHSYKVIIPSSDGTIAILNKHRSELDVLTRVALAHEIPLHMAINKKETLKAAEKVGIKVPHSIPVAKRGDIAHALAVLNFPLVVKPTESWVEDKRGRKRLISELATNSQEAYEAFKRLSLYGGTTIFQEYLPGKREAVSLIYSNKKIYARFAQWAKRTQPPLGGMSVLRESVAIPADIGKQSIDLIREINLEGYSEVEYRRDSRGVPYLMEINPRLSASVEVGVHAGVDFPYLLYQWASGKKIDTIQTYQFGLWERYLAGDIVSSTQALQESGRPGIDSRFKVIADFVSSFFKPMKYDYIDWTDMRPAYAATSDFIVRNINKFKTK